MSEALGFETDEFLKLLTEALRAGPGSPQWHEVVTQLRALDASETDEYRLLIRARERLESGREYRSVRAGPGFTRKVMEGVDRAAGERARMPSAALIAWLAAGVIVAVAIAVVAWLTRGASPAVEQDLGSMYFSTTSISSDFSQGIPSEWRKFGLEPVVSAKGKGLRSGFTKGREKEYQGGGIVAAGGFEPGQSFAVEAAVRISKASPQVDLRLFVAQDAWLDSTSAATSRGEFVADLLDGQVSVFRPDGTLAGQQAAMGQGGDLVHLLIKMDRRNAIVEVDGRRLYAGPHGLAGDKPRWPGIRFLATGSEKSLEDVVVQSVRVLKP
jgi:hypothetical protein